MTYCFAFKAIPEENCFLAFSGLIGQIQELTAGLGEKLKGCGDNHQYETFLKFVRSRFDEMWKRGAFNYDSPEIALIYADISHMCAFHAIRPPSQRPFGQVSRSEATQDFQLIMLPRLLSNF